MTMDGSKMYLSITQEIEALHAQFREGKLNPVEYALSLDKLSKRLTGAVQIYEGRLAYTQRRNARRARREHLYK